MSYRIIPNIICFYAQKKLNTLNNIGVLLKSVLFDLHACKFMHVKISLHAPCVHTRHNAHNLSSPGNLKIKLYGKRLYSTESVKYLGVKTDTNLSWQNHVNDLSIKLNRANALLLKMRNMLVLKY